MADTGSSRKVPSRKVIELRGVTRRYGINNVVDNVDLSVCEGERFALLGHNGAGKTTLIKMMLGICRPTSGEITLQGRKFTSMENGGGNIGYLPESVSFHESMTGREVMRFYAALKKQDKNDCDVLIDQVGLTDAASRRVQTYSKGMRQRLGLAQAMLGDPPLMLLDEPTTGLDPDLRGLFYDIINQRTAAGSTALISSHALSEIEANVDRIAILKNGSLIACGTLDELRHKAGIPATIRVHVPFGGARSVAEGLGGMASIQKVNDRTVEIGCIDNQKIDALMYLGNLDGPVLDVDICPVNLEQLYSYYTSSPGGSQ